MNFIFLKNRHNNIFITTFSRWLHRLSIKYVTIYYGGKAVNIVYRHNDVLYGIVHHNNII